MNTIAYNIRSLMLLLFVGGVGSFGAVQEPDAEPEGLGNRFAGRNREYELRNLDVEEARLKARLAEIADRRREIHDLQRAQGPIEEAIKLIKSKNLLSDRAFINDPNFTVDKQRLIALCILAMVGFERENILSYLAKIIDSVAHNLRDHNIEERFIPGIVQAFKLSFRKLTQVQPTETDRFYQEAKTFVEFLDRQLIPYNSIPEWERIKPLLEQQVGPLPDQTDFYAREE